MGNKCGASSKGSSLSKTKTLIINLQSGQYNLNIGNAQPLKFIIEIDKIKCKNLTQVFFTQNFFFNSLTSFIKKKTDCFVSFNFDDQKLINTSILTNDKNPRVHL